jgi:hypothetical protein
MEVLRPLEQIQESINKRYGKLHWCDEEGKNRPFVCTLHDEVIMSGNDIKLLDPEVLTQTYVCGICMHRKKGALEDIYYSSTSFLQRMKKYSCTKGLSLSQHGCLHCKPMTKKVIKVESVVLPDAIIVKYMLSRTKSRCTL